MYHRGGWSRGAQAGYVIASALAHPFLGMVVALSCGPHLPTGSYSRAIDRMAAFYASLPLVIYAMRQSRLFVAPVIGDREESSAEPLEPS
jgi:hypothetical protein